ncbi:MAG: TlpA disulfide reductase family protein [Crocinitomicaceae bacterium]
MKYLLQLFTGLVALSAFSQTSTLTGKIENPYQDYVYLRYYKQENRQWIPVILDSSKIEKGEFKLAVNLDSLSSIQFFDGNEQTQIYLNKGENLHLTLNTLMFDESIHYSGVASGRNNYMSDLGLAEEIQFMGFNVKTKDCDESDTSEVFEFIEEQIDRLVKYTDQGLESYPEIEFYLTDKKNYYDWMKGRYKSIVRTDIKFKLLEKELKGKMLDDIAGIDLKEKDLKLSSFYGKPIVVDFWATWCGPCKYEIPYLQEIEKEYKGKVNIISVCVWDKKDKWLEGAPQYGFENNIFLNKEQSDPITQKYQITGIPRYIVLDNTGKIVHLSSERPSGDLRGQLDELLGQ